MKKIILGIVIGMVFGTILAYADKISAPPPIQDRDIYHYFRQIYENYNRLEVVTTNPDGARNGKKGDMLLLQTGGNSYLEINSASSNVWLGVLLQDTP